MFVFPVIHHLCQAQWKGWSRWCRSTWWYRTVWPGSPTGSHQHHQLATSSLRWTLPYMWMLLCYYNSKVFLPSYTERPVHCNQMGPPVIWGRLWMWSILWSIISIHWLLCLCLWAWQQPMGLFYDDIKAFLCETPLSPIEVPHVINRWHQSWELTGRKSSWGGWGMVQSQMGRCQGVCPETKVCWSMWWTMPEISTTGSSMLLWWPDWCQAGMTEYH